ncbi:phosphoglycerate mutase-like protein [Hypoxylon fuscum]|nr:phosphoglycerate mutase-like protein [Hypoxylon fuscum]
MSTPTIDIIRHATAEHNVTNLEIQDPRITKNEGLTECNQLKQSYPWAEKVFAVWSSPMRRAIDTARHSIMPLLRPEQQIVLWPELQEVNDRLDGTGSPCPVLRSIYGDAIDLAQCEYNWFLKDSDSLYAPAPDKVDTRAQIMRRELRKVARQAVEQGKPDAHIVVFTHGEFAHWLTDDFEGVTEHRNSGWYTTETRSYKFEDLFAASGPIRLLEQETPERAYMRQAEARRDYPGMGPEKRKRLQKEAAIGRAAPQGLSPDELAYLYGVGQGMSMHQRI